MIGLGTVINVSAILTGGLLGLLGGQKLPRCCQQTVTRGMGICTLFIGISGMQTHGNRNTAIVTKQQWPESPNIFSNISSYLPPVFYYCITIRPTGK